MDSELHFHADLLSSLRLRAALLLSVFLCCLTSLPKGSFPLPFSPQLHAAQRAALCLPPIPRLGYLSLPKAAPLLCELPKGQPLSPAPRPLPQSSLPLLLLFSY
ncbi:hypothetical protein ACFX14_009922 [Malus domestica]